MAKRLGEETTIQALIREATRAYDNIEVIHITDTQGTAVVQCLNHSDEGTIGIYILFEILVQDDIINAYCSMSEMERAQQDVVEFLQPIISRI